MSKVTTDVDVDFLDRTTALEVLPHIPALMVNNNKLMRHSTGVYFQNIPTDPLTGIASIPYSQAEDLGYMKIDFLNNSIYSGIRDREHLDELVAREPSWDLLLDRDFVSLLAHVHSHFDVVDAIQPQSITDLAVILALIRPGKRHLVHESRATIDADIWTKPTDGAYHFKKSHAFAFAMSIAVQMNLLVEQILE